MRPSCLSIDPLRTDERGTVIILGGAGERVTGLPLFSAPFELSSSSSESMGEASCEEMGELPPRRCGGYEKNLLLPGRRVGDAPGEGVPGTSGLIRPSWPSRGTLSLSGEDVAEVCLEVIGW